MDNLEAALAAIDALGPDESFTYTEIAKKYGVVRSTLTRRHQGQNASRAIGGQKRQLLYPQQEQELIAYINQLTDRGLPPTQPMIRNFASQIAKKEVGLNWASRFVQRYPDQLTSRWATALDNCRHKADSRSKYSLYFSLLRDKIDQYGVEARHIYNMDEKGFMLGIVSPSRRIFSKASYKGIRGRSTIQDGSRQWITLLACICADGSYLEPALIYQSGSGSIQDTWLQALDPDTHQIQVSSSPSGWTNNEIGLAWLQQVFDRSTRAKARSSYRLLILDGHGSHLTRDFIDYCDQNKILLAVYPPHSTHTLQPLDVSMFKPLSTAYSNEVSAFMDRSQGLTSMSKRDFLPLFQAAWKASFKETTILNAFKATGLSPFDPGVILQRFSIPDPTSDSDSSALSTSDWRRIERLLRQVVAAQGDRQVKRLSQILHSSSVQNSLLKDENRKLREALINERTRRKRGKPLPLQEAEDYHGGAVFWSLRKVKEARDRLRLQEEKEELLQLQKADTMRQREEARQEKVREKELRRQARLAARLVREKEREEKAIEKASRIAARKTAKRLQKAIKTSQKGRRSSLKASIKATRKKRPIARRQGDEEAQGGATGSPPPTSRRGRAIRTPSRFL
jgi:hypothetical protein